METFEVCIIKLDRPSDEDVDRLYKARDLLNEKYAGKAGGETIMKFIVVPSSVHVTCYLMYETTSLEEALKYRMEVRDCWNNL